MTSTIAPADTGEVARVALAQIHDGISVLQGLDLSGVGVGEELLGLLVEQERAERRLAAARTRVVAEVEVRAVAWDKGCKSTAVLLRDLLVLAPGEAKARVRAAANTGPRVSVAGERLAPVFETVAAAQAAGEVSEQQARLIARTVEKLPDAIRDEHGEWLEQFLVQNAAQFDPLLLGRLATRAVATLDPDGILHDQAYRERVRELVVQVRADGSSRVSGELTAQATEYLLVAMDALAGPAPAEDGTRDLRTPAQRRHDALLETMKIAVASGLVPKAGGVTSTLILTMSEDSLRSGQGLAKTSHGALIPADSAVEWMREGGAAYLMGVVLNSMKAISAYSDKHRIFTEQQRLAMFGRDRGWCTMPGCDAPPGMAEAHHVTDFAITRRTSVDDGTLACCTDHQQRIDQGWTTKMINGRPHWIPPAWLDPEGKPRRNTWNDL